MNEYRLEITAQSSFYKNFSSKSKDTGIFIPSDLEQFLGYANVYNFTIFREDCVKAMANIICSLPLYTSVGGIPEMQTDATYIYEKLSKEIEMFFNGNTKGIYGPFSLNETTNERKYLYKLEKKGLSIRDFLISNLSTIIFEKKGNDIELRIITKLSNDERLQKPSLPTTSVSPSLSPLLAAICTKPFVLLAGISGTGKSRIVRRLAQATDTIRKYDALQDRWDNHNPDNFCLIQVKPNWHNSMDVVGYLSNLNGPHYVLTPFVRFVAQAWINPNIPYFLCLDEMNLAPVEEYFAEFLSAIESRTIDADDHYWTDPIIQPLKNFGEAISRQIIRELLGDKLYHEKQDLEAQFYEHGLTLPPNLVVMGTVNMDETTFSFSRKVLDRAMSIEMNEVDFDAYLNRQSDLVNADLTANNAKFVQRVINGAAYANENFAFEVKEYLTKINQTLENTPFKLGYRAINEALIYVAAAQSFNISVDDALDNFTLMKILSRIEGDSSKLTVSADNAAGGTAARNLLTVLQGVVKGDKSKAKLQQMSAVLERDHFVSYWG